MITSNIIVLIDPALQNNQGKIASNLGNLIISESNRKILQSVFPTKEIISISSHVQLEKNQKDLVKNSFLSFIGGTNLLFSDMLTWREILLRKGKLVWLFPGVSNLILLGTGWGQGYDQRLTFRTKILYKNILHPHYIHSTRDSYSAAKLYHQTGRKTINTTCTSMWNLNGINVNRQKKDPACLFTLTDYDVHRELDTLLVQELFTYFTFLHFFPQGSKDIEYLYSLEVYQKNKTKFNLLPHSYNDFKKFVANESFTYVGTRLHGGIKCLQHNHETLIIGIDHRALEIAKDTNLPVIKRADIDALKKWIDGKSIFYEPIKIPLNNIQEWSAQFN